MMSRNLFKKLFGRETAAAPPRLPDGVRVYAIGDVHGRLDLLLAVEAAIAAHEATAPPAAAEVILLGDYVDRGPDSAGVVAHLLDRRLAGLPARCLMGNHEDAMLRFLDDAAIAPVWFQHGGLATLASYGVRPAGAESDDRNERLRQGLVETLPDAHRAFLGSLDLSIERGGYLFVHAGVRPGRALADQSRDDLLTIREPFLGHRGPLPWRVVHGHTIADDPEFRSTRIGIDTGAFATGRLTCVVIEGDSVRLLPDAPTADAAASRG